MHDKMTTRWKTKRSKNSTKKKRHNPKQWKKGTWGYWSQRKKCPTSSSKTSWLMCTPWQNIRTLTNQYPYKYFYNTNARQTCHGYFYHVTRLITITTSKILLIASLIVTAVIPTTLKFTCLSLNTSIKSIGLVYWRRHTEIISKIATLSKIVQTAVN